MNLNGSNYIRFKDSSVLTLPYNPQRSSLSTTLKSNTSIGKLSVSTPLKSNTGEPSVKTSNVMINFNNYQVCGTGGPVMKCAPMYIRNHAGMRNCLSHLQFATNEVSTALAPIPIIRKWTPSEYRKSRVPDISSSARCSFLEQPSPSATYVTPVKHIYISHHNKSLSLSQIETVVIPPAGKVRPPKPQVIALKESQDKTACPEFNPHPYDDDSSMDMYINPAVTLLRKLQRIACETATKTSLYPKRRRRRVKPKPKCTNSIVSCTRNTEPFHIQHLSLLEKQKQMLDVLKELRLDLTPHLAHERVHATRRRRSGLQSRSLYSSKHHVSDMSGWITETPTPVVVSHALVPSPPKAPKKQTRKVKKHKRLQVIGHAVTTAANMPVVPIYNKMSLVPA